jgi:transcriptional regulator with XRE-family HTH domain
MARQKSQKNPGFAERLLQLFELAGINGRIHRAEYIDVHPNSYDNYTKGKVPEWDTLSAISQKFGVSIDWLLMGIEEEQGQGSSPAGGEAIIRLPRGDPSPLDPQHADLLEKALVVLRATGDASHFSSALQNNIDSFYKGVQQANQLAGSPRGKAAKAH